MKIKQKTIYLFINKHKEIEAHARINRGWIAKRGKLEGIEIIIQSMFNSLNLIEKKGWDFFEEYTGAKIKKPYWPHVPNNPKYDKYPIIFIPKNEIKKFYNETTYRHI